MSEYHIPFHVQAEIMKRLPVKSLIQFRSVSKAWKSLIDSSEFIAAHHTQQQHLLVSYQDLQREESYVCYIDDDTFARQRSVPTLPLSAKQLKYLNIVGSSHGLVCLYGYDPIRTTRMAVIWNPSIRKHIVVGVPEKTDGVGFGVCPVTNDPKIVSITQLSRDVVEASYTCEVMVYTLSSDKWRSLSTNLLTKRIWDLFYSIVTNGFIYWRVGTLTHNKIMSFDVTNESFEVIDLPDSLALILPNQRLVQISKLRESLAVFQDDGNFRFLTVWIMENGAQRLFTKVFTITTQHNNLVGFTKNGIPIMIVTDGDDNDGRSRSKLVVFEPNSEHKNVLAISPSSHFYYVNYYVETLLLLGRSNCNNY